MVYFTLRGGLANMMFQIAAVNSIAWSKGDKCSFHNIDTHLPFLNAHKQLNNRLVDALEYRKLNFLKDVITDPVSPNLKVYSYPFHFVEHDLKEENVGLDGFFQSEKYFKEHEDRIRELFKPTEEINIEIDVKYGWLFKDGTRNTSIHVRRGDYLRHPNHHPVQPLEYYQKAIDLTKDATDRYIIFSDDIPWCKQVFKGDGFIFMDGNEKDYIELYLMSRCNNNITCNSSFSWWGAWLNNNENKIVIGPKMWFGNAYNHFNTNDVLPESWIKI